MTDTAYGPIDNDKQKELPVPVPHAYPRLLRLDSSVEEALKNYLDKCLQDHFTERTAWIDDIIHQQADYYAKPPSGSKDSPFKNACKLVIPLTAIAFEAVHSRTMTTLTGLKQIVSATAISDNWAEAVKPYEKYINNELKVSKFRESIEPSILELEKLGTGIGRAEWEQIVKYGMAQIGDEEVEIPVVVRRGAKIFSVPLTRFIMSFSETDEQMAQWCGEIHEDTEHNLYLHTQSGLFYPDTYSKLCEWARNTAPIEDRSTTAQELRENRAPTFPSKITWYAIWLSYPVAYPDLKHKEILVYYHYDSRTLMGVRYNFYKDLRRPYRRGVYFPIEHRWAGIGIAKQNEQFQEEVTTQHRQRIDNATLANMRMFKVSRLSGYGPREPLMPGKFWFLDDMSHVEPIQVAEVYPSSYNNENQSVLYSQQRTGVNEVTLGMPQVGTPGTATGDIARVQEGKRKFDYSYSNIKTFANSLINDFSALYHQFGPRDVRWIDENDPNGKVLQLLTLPEEYVTQGIILEIVAAGEQDNMAILRNNWTQIAAYFNQYIDGNVKLAQLKAQYGADPLMSLILDKGMSGSSEIMKQIIESYNMPNVDKIVIKELLNGSYSPAGNGIISGGSAGITGLSQTSRLSAPTNIPQANSNNGAGGVNELLPALRGL